MRILYAVVPLLAGCPWTTFGGSQAVTLTLAIR